MVATTPAFCIYIDTIAEGTVPSVRDENDLPCVFATRLEAEREIADNMMSRLQEFMDGERDFDDAMTVEEYIVEVDVQPDGSIVDEDGNHFGPRRSF
jgi:serine phosphatase RsbU (regulator of sigma subunit)